MFEMMTIPVNESCKYEVIQALWSMALDKIWTFEYHQYLQENPSEEDSKWASELINELKKHVPEAEIAYYEAQVICKLAGSRTEQFNNYNNSALLAESSSFRNWYFAKKQEIVSAQQVLGSFE